MSDKPKFPRAVALAAAEEVAEALRPMCARCKIVGSLRRGELFVGDIEVLYVPVINQGRDPSDFFGDAMILVNLADLVIDRLLDTHVIARRKNVKGSEMWGSENKFAVHVASGVPIDLFATTEAKWYVSLVIRTGPKSLNLRLTTSAQAHGRSLLAYGEGVKDIETGNVFPAESEEAVFALCNVPYIQPYDR